VQVDNYPSEREIRQQNSTPDNVATCKRRRCTLLTLKQDAKSIYIVLCLPVPQATNKTDPILPRVNPRLTACWYHNLSHGGMAPRGLRVRLILPVAAQISRHPPQQRRFGGWTMEAYPYVTQTGHRTGGAAATAETISPIISHVSNCKECDKLVKPM